MNTTRTRSPFDEWAADNDEVVRFLTDPGFDPENSRFLADLARQVRRRRPLTPDQAAAVFRNITRRQARARRLSAPVADPAVRETAPQGRVEVEGVVVEVAIGPGFTPDRPDHKMTVDCGYLVLCTVPRALVLDPAADDLGLTGARVRFAVTLTPNPDNPCRALGKAPRRVALVSRPARSGDHATASAA